MNARLGWALAVAMVALGGWQWGWRGVVLGATVVVFWLLLQFGRSLRVLQRAGGAPVGTVANAVMLHSRLKTGMTLMQILPMTSSLGQKLADDPETFEWRDGGGDRVTVVLNAGSVSQWTLQRAPAEGQRAEAAGPADAA